MRHTCKNCGLVVKIPESWISRGKDIKICCRSCNEKVNLNIEKHFFFQSEPKKSMTGTVLTEVNDLKVSTKHYRLTISHGHSKEILTIIQMIPNKTYVLGRSAEKIKTHNPIAEPILIPTKFDSAVSRVHFELKVVIRENGSKLIVKDLNSMHKTHIYNEHNIKETIEAEEQVFIEINDKIRIGQNTLISFSSN